ncbi:unnamed protein product [Polarella glacialis]|uniref:Uncharacterized protein n=1 Tax=Polarella glacialis TaxID=89957 RepID=A0A813D2I4_POLGL|nr:unnamed protein product [Polarella glacialis]
MQPTSEPGGEKAPAEGNVHLEDMVSATMERTEQLEQNFVAVSSQWQDLGDLKTQLEDLSSQFQGASLQFTSLSSELDDLRSRNTSCETQLMSEMAGISQTLRTASEVGGRRWEARCSIFLM